MGLAKTGLMPGDPGGVPSAAAKPEGGVPAGPDSARGTPGITVPPPLLFLAAFGLALALERAWPLMPGAPSWIAWLGFACLVMSQAWIFRCLVTLRQNHTSASPYKPTLALCQNGPYGLSRNPLYLGLVGLYAGVTLLFRVGWALPLLLPALALLSRGVVAREERYLAARFGEAYADYCRRVRRWL